MAFLLYLLFVNFWLMPFCVYCGGSAKSAPELKVHPRLRGPSDRETSIIWYTLSDRGNISALTQDLDNFLSGYRTPGLLPGRGQNVVNCDYDHPPRREEVCDVNVRNWGPCTRENHYGYHMGTPCIFFSLDKMFGWEAEFYNDTTTLPNMMPEDLREYIGMQAMRNIKFANQVWLTCEGEHPVDAENIGPIEYVPQRGFPGYFFPFKDVEGNLSPLVAIRFERPQRGILISVVCKIWARNVRHSEAEIVRFELLVD